jgi:hypothetical protein
MTYGVLFNYIKKIVVSLLTQDYVLYRKWGGGGQPGWSS